MLLTEKSQILKRWVKHFRSVLNRLSTISDAAPQMTNNLNLHPPPFLPGTVRAVKQLSSGKFPGFDATQAEIYKHGGHRLMNHLTALFEKIWRQGKVFQDFKGAVIVHFYMRKTNRRLW
ncbi:hypothetical protein SprV_0602071700 [Sparganum proliferum]